MVVNPYCGMVARKSGFMPMAPWKDTGLPMLLEHLEKKSVTNAVLGGWLGKDSSAASRLRNGHTTPDADDLAAICTHLGLSADRLLGIAGPASKSVDELHRRIQAAKRDAEMAKREAEAALRDLEALEGRPERRR